MEQYEDMHCDVFNGHPLYQIEGAADLCDLLEQFVPIHYDEISVAFLPEATICDLHRDFLNDDTPTDVITFPAAPDDVERVGEICISVDEALKWIHVQALPDELTLYLVHGWLHLANYDDIAEADRLKMRQMEKETFLFLDTQPVKRLSCVPIKTPKGAK